jgi:hypothetical protein
MRKQEEEKALIIINKGKRIRLQKLMPVRLITIFHVKYTAQILFTPQNSTAYTHDGCESDKSSIVCTTQKYYTIAVHIYSGHTIQDCQVHQCSDSHAFPAYFTP